MTIVQWQTVSVTSSGTLTRCVTRGRRWLFVDPWYYLGVRYNCAGTLISGRITQGHGDGPWVLVGTERFTFGDSHGHGSNSFQIILDGSFFLGSFGLSSS